MAFYKVVFAGTIFEELSVSPLRWGEGKEVIDAKKELNPNTLSALHRDTMGLRFQQTTGDAIEVTNGCPRGI